MAAIEAERNKQDEKYGIGNYIMTGWLAILIEEVGELAAAIIHQRFGKQDYVELDWRKECVHIAAVAVRMLEQAERSEQ